jgi:hypothetical protein
MDLEKKRIAQKRWLAKNVEHCQQYRKEKRAARMPEQIEADKIAKKLYDQSPAGRAGERKEKRKPKNRFKSSIRQAKQRDLSWTISFEEWQKIVEKPCYYCNGHLGVSVTGSGLDRINNSVGYELDNVISCCGTCNKSRNALFSMEEFKIMIDALLQHRNKK